MEHGVLDGSSTALASLHPDEPRHEPGGACADHGADREGAEPGGLLGQAAVGEAVRHQGPGRCHGFDESKFNAASMFFLPCQAQDPKDSFFRDYGEGDPKRGSLDLHAWIEDCILNLRAKAEPVVAAPLTSAVPGISTTQVAVKLEKVRATLEAEQTQILAERRDGWVAEAVERWQGSVTIPGTGHSEFFRLAAALHRAGLDESEIRARLYDEAAYARSPRERRAEINGILPRLHRRGTFRRAAR